MADRNQANAGLPLAGIKVLDFSRVLAGPWATMSLSDLGAEVWKIENADGGDDTRAWSHPNYKGVSTYYLSANRGKKSIALDLKSKQGLEIVRQLAKKCDVVVENFRVGTAERLGIGYEQLRKINPGLVYCSISGYGRDAAAARRPGYDFVLQAESGLMAITGEPDGQPLRFGTAIVDLTCGMIATQSVIAALFQRQKTGEGQHIDATLLDSALNMLINVGSGFLNAGGQVKRFGNAHPTVVPYQIFDCSDGNFALAVGTDRQFRALCQSVIGAPQLCLDDRFRSAEGRARNREALIPLLQDIFVRNSRQHWMDACAAAEVPAGIVKTVGEALNGALLDERGVIQTLNSAYLGPVSLVRPAHGIASQKKADYLAPPMLGQDTQAVLRDVLSYSEAQISQMEEAGVIAIFREQPLVEEGVAVSTGEVRQGLSS